MAINQILSIPDWQKLTTFTNSIAPLGGFSQIYPGPNNYWYVTDGTSGIVKRLALDFQFGNGLSTGTSPTESFVNQIIDINAGSGLSFSYSGVGSQIYVTGLTTGNLSIIGSFTQGYVLSGATNGSFEWIAAGSASVQGTSGSIAKFTSNSSVGDSIMRESSNSVLIGTAPVSVIGNTRFGVSGSVYVSDSIYLGDNPNRYIAFNNSTNVEISTTGDFKVVSYTNSQYSLIDAKTNLSTNDRTIEFLSGLVSVNDTLGKPSLMVNTNSNSATFYLNNFLGTISGTYGVALGLTGGIQIQDGTEGQHKVLVSSTTAGHGIWATMVGLNSAETIYNRSTQIRLPIYQSPNSFELGSMYKGPSNSSSDGVNFFARNYTYSVVIATQSFFATRYWDNTRIQGNFDVLFEIPNMGSTYGQFLMSKSNQIRYGSLTLLDENEITGHNNSQGGVFSKDLSNTVLGPGSSGVHAWKPGNRHNSMRLFLNSDRNQGILMQGWNFPNFSLSKPAGFTAGSGTVFQQETLSMLGSPGASLWPRVMYHDFLTWYTPTPWLTGATISAEQGQPDRFRSLTSNATQSPAFYSGSFDTQVIRRKTNVVYNSLSLDNFKNILYNYDYSRMGYTGSLTSSSVNIDTVLSHYFKLESGEFTGSITQSTVLFINPQFGSFTTSGVIAMTASRQVGLHVSQEVGYLLKQPNGYVKEAYDYISGRISNGHTESNIESHIGYFAQSKLVGTQWNPMGRRVYDFGIGPSLNGGLTRATPGAWPTYSIYNVNKPWSFFAERDKSNLGGGLLIDMGATFGTPLRAFLEIEGVTQSIGNKPFVVSSTISVFQRDGSYITYPFSGATYATFSATYPQVLLRPGVTPSSQEDGSLWYTPGNLSFVDGGITYNLLSMSGSSIITSLGGVTGLGTSNYVPVWTGVSSLKATSSIYISNAGDGNVGINLKYYPDYSLQVATTSLSPNIALGISGSILYQDGSHGTTGSVMMADSTGKTNLYPLVLPGPGLTYANPRVGFSYSSGYLPLYVGRGTQGPGGTGPSGSSEYQLGSIMVDSNNTEISLLIQPQSQFASSNPVPSGARGRSLTFRVPSLVNSVPSGLTQTVDFVMNFGDQTIDGVKVYNDLNQFKDSIVLNSTTSTFTTNSWLRIANTYSTHNKPQIILDAGTGPSTPVTGSLWYYPYTFSGGWTGGLYFRHNNITYNLLQSTGGGGIGPQGPAGPAGSGSQGPVGPDGAQGFQGFQGFQGPTGLRGATGSTGATGVVSVGIFTQSNFYPYGATLSSTGILLMGAAGTAFPGLIHTGSQTFSGDKYFQGDIYLGPTNNGGIFLYDGKGLTYSGFIGPTGLPTNIIYRLPPTASLDRYLKTCTTDGVNWSLVWATASAPPSGLSITSKQVVFGNGSGVTSVSNFCFDSSISDFIATQNPTNTSSGGSNIILGGDTNTSISSQRSSLIGGNANCMCCGNRSVIIGGINNYIKKPILAQSGCPETDSAIIGGGCNTILNGSGIDANPYIGGSGILAGKYNNLCFSKYAGIISGSSNTVATSSSSVIVGGFNNCILNSDNSSIIGGCGLTLGTASNTVLVPSLRIDSVTGPVNTESRILVWNVTDKSVRWRSASTLGGGGGTVSIPTNEVPFGTVDGIGLTSSPTFKFWGEGTSLIAASNSTLGATQGSNVILGGFTHSLSTSTASTIIGGCGNTITSSSNSSIMGGTSSTIQNNSRNSSIVGGFCSTIGTSSSFSSIVGGFCATIQNNSCQATIIGSVRSVIGTASCKSFIMGGNNNLISDCAWSSGIIASEFSTITSLAPAQPPGYSPWTNNSIIAGGGSNKICRTSSSTIIGGGLNVIWHAGTGNYSSFNSIMGGKSNCIKTYGFYNSIVGGQSSCIVNRNCNSVILGGGSNRIYNTGWVNGVTQKPGNHFSAIIGGTANSIEACIADNGNCCSIIIGGASNRIGSVSSPGICKGSCGSALIGGFDNTIIFGSNNSSILSGTGSSMSCSSNSVIIGGSGLTLSNVTNMVYVPKLMISSASNDSTPTQSLSLTWDSNDKIVYSTPNPFATVGLTTSVYASLVPAFATQAVAGNNLGTTTSRWANIYADRIFVSKASIYLGDVKLSEVGGQLQIENLAATVSTPPIIIGGGTGPQGLTGPQGTPSVSNLLTSINPSSSTLTVTHSFGTYPMVQAIDGSGYNILSTSYSILHSSTNSYTITFNATYSGYVITGGGLTGSQGVTGFQGFQGRTGPQGFTGNQGVTGFQGRTGPQGITGPQGFQGTAGTPGGPQGVQGVQGPGGPQGDQGFQGPDGPQGVQGFQGDQGFQGVTGPSGGPIGPTGLQGVTGPQGMTGNMGPGGSAQNYGTYFTPFTIYTLPSTSPAPVSPGEMNFEVSGSYTASGVTGSLKIYDQDKSSNPLAYYWNTLLNNSIANPNNVIFISGYYNFSLSVSGGTYSSNYYNFDVTIIGSDTNELMGSDYTQTIYYYLAGPANTLSRNDYVSSVTMSTITHSSNTYPLVQVVDNVGNSIIPFAVEHISTLAYTVKFSSAFTGTIITGGAAGPQGGTGTQGPQGLQGVTGLQGATGSQGFQGVTGPQGPNDLPIPANEIVFGLGIGLTSSVDFIFDNTNYLFVVGENNFVNPNSLNSTIIGGSNSSITTNSYSSSILGGYGSGIVSSKYSSIIGGQLNQILYNSYRNTVLGGDSNIISTNVINSTILGGSLNSIESGSKGSSILGGCNNCSTLYSYYSGLVGGSDNNSSNSYYSSIISGKTNCIVQSQYVSIIGGRMNSISGCSSATTIIGGCQNLSDASCFSSILGGCGNTLQAYSNYSLILGGISNTLISSTNSVIIGGQGLSFSNKVDTVIVPSLIVASSSTTRSHINLVAGASPSVPVDGDMWYDGAHLYFQKGVTTVQLT